MKSLISILAYIIVIRIISDALTWLENYWIRNNIYNNILTLIFIYTLTAIFPHTSHSPPHPGHMKEMIHLNTECKQIVFVCSFPKDQNNRIERIPAQIPSMRCRPAAVTEGNVWTPKVWVLPEWQKISACIELGSQHHSWNLLSVSFRSVNIL